MDYELIIKTFAGLEQILAKEVAQLGGRDVVIGSRMVTCKGDLGFVYKANFSLRTALRVLVPIKRFTIDSQDDYYKQLLSFDWSEWMTPEQTFKVYAITNKTEHFDNSHYAALLCKDAIVDFFKENDNERPSVEKDSPDFYIHIYVYKSQLTLMFDSSGESLHKRGYKVDAHEATLNEVLAAGMLKIADWDGKGNLLDPMCGGATIPIEAAMMAMQIPPQIHRPTFSFEHWPNFDQNLWDQIRDSRIAKIRDFAYHISAYDKEVYSLEKASHNIEAADLGDFIHLEQQDFFETKKIHSPLMMLINPPYDVRMEQNDDEFNRKIGNCLKNNYQNSIAWVISAESNMWKEIGLKADKKMTLYNGSLECGFNRYITYD